MASHKRSLLWCVLAAAPVAGCTETPIPDAPPGVAYLPPGSGDKNTRHYNLYLDKLRDAASWAPDTTGEASVSALSDFRFQPRPATSACVDLSHEPRVRVVGSYRAGARTIGADALITGADGIERAMTPGEEVDFAAWLVNSAGRREEVTLHLVRGKALSMPDSAWLEWPFFALTVTSEATCEPLAKAVVQFGPGWQLPTVAGQEPTVDPIGFGAYATAYRDEVTALVAKAELFGGLPAAIGDEADADLLVACGNESVSSRAAMFNSLASLGNGAWSHVPGDAEANPVLYFLTEDGFPVVLHAGAAVGGRMFGLCWGSTFAGAHAGEALPRLALPQTEVYGLDAIHASGIALQASERATALPTAFARGTASLRQDAFSETGVPDAAQILEQVRANVSRTRIGETQGAVRSWTAARELLRTRASLVTVAVPQNPSGFAPVMITASFEYERPPIVDDGWCIYGESACDPDLGFPRDPDSCLFDSDCELGATPGTPSAPPATTDDSLPGLPVVDPGLSL